MNFFVGVGLVVALSVPTSVRKSTDKPATPAEEYAAVLSEYRPASAGIRGAENDLQRKAAVERMGSFAPKFIELAERHRDDRVALQALRQAVQIIGSTDSGAQIAWETNKSNFPTGCADEVVNKVVTLILRDQLHSDKLGPVVDRMRYGYRIEFDKCLSAVLEKNPHREVRALACLSLAQFLNDRLRMLRLLEDRPELAECYEIVFGGNYLPALRQLGRGNLAERIEALFERAAGEYGDVKLRSGTIGERARMELYEIRHLGIGKVAPDIAGKDQDGKHFKLSNYRGKVVLLYFWSEF